MNNIALPKEYHKSGVRYILIAKSIDKDELFVISHQRFNNKFFAAGQKLHDTDDFTVVGTDMPEDEEERESLLEEINEYYKGSHLYKDFRFLKVNTKSIISVEEE